MDAGQMFSIVAVECRRGRRNMMLQWPKLKLHNLLNKSEYVIYKLKEMGKVTEKDIMQVSEKFDILDTGNCGKITLGDLMESQN
ncbi:two-pore potassium channel 3-like protein [Trifolium pratense]|uniref:Two-pore potassium channel 3-like protein n=1 Tax=Trifolium pratense TaxID=57577 RepID=A0A2K3NUN6_TRIPR|nr:two-pore potassium channel 3-like protein [Trifolium pratense]